MFCVGQNPTGRLGQLQADAPGAGEARLAGGAGLPADRVGAVLEGLARARVRGGARAGHPDRGVLPARGRAHREGRHLHQHPAAAAVAPQGLRAARGLPLGAALDLPPRQGDPREAGRLGGPEGPADPRPDVGLPAAGPQDEPDAEHVLQEISGRKADGSFLESYDALEGDGSTTCGSWIHCGVYKDGVNQAARKKPAHRAELDRARVGLGVAEGHADHLQPRLGRSRRQAVVRAQALRLVGRRGGASGRASATRPDFPPTKAPDYKPARNAKKMEAIARRQAVHPASRRAGLAVLADRASSTARCPPTTSRRSPRSGTSSTPSSRTRRGRCFTARRTPTTRPTASRGRTCSRSCSPPTG